jgi:hypothetical protein
MTRKNPRLRSPNAPLRAEFADSTTCRRAMLTRHAVVPKVMDCHQGSSTGIAVRIPSQQHLASVSTNGAVRDRRMVFGNERLRSSPEQNGHRHRVTPINIGTRTQGQPPPGPLVELRLAAKLLLLRCPPGRDRQVPNLLREQGREDLPGDQKGIPRERLPRR